MLRRSHCLVPSWISASAVVSCRASLPRCVTAEKWIRRLRLVGQRDGGDHRVNGVTVDGHRHLAGNAVGKRDRYSNLTRRQTWRHGVRGSAGGVAVRHHVLHRRREAATGARGSHFVGPKGRVFGAVVYRGLDVVIDVKQVAELERSGEYRRQYGRSNGELNHCAAALPFPSVCGDCHWTNFTL